MKNKATVFISLILILSLGCTNSINEKEDTISHFKKSKISSFIDFDNEVQVLDNECLLTFKESLLDIIWSHNDSLIRGISFIPKVSNNPYSHFKGEKKWLCFFISTIEGKDTNYTYEAYYFNGHFNSMNPCHFENKNIIRVDSDIEIIPHLSILENNCVLKITNTDLAPGVFKKVVNPIDINLFHTYLDEFKSTQLPFSINKDFLTENVIIDTKLDSIYNPFIDKEIIENTQMDYPYTHFAIMKFNVSESKIGLVVKEQGLAGGIEDYYILYIFSNDGILLSKTTIAEYTSECAYETITTCEISKRLDLSILTNEYSGDCFGDSLELKNSTVKKLFIEESGVVK